MRETRLHAEYKRVMLEVHGPTYARVVATQNVDTVFDGGHEPSSGSTDGITVTAPALPRSTTFASEEAVPAQSVEGATAALTGSGSNPNVGQGPGGLTPIQETDVESAPDVGRPSAPLSYAIHSPKPTPRTSGGEGGGQSPCSVPEMSADSPEYLYTQPQVQEAFEVESSGFSDDTEEAEAKRETAHAAFEAFAREAYNDPGEPTPYETQTAKMQVRFAMDVRELKKEWQAEYRRIHPNVDEDDPDYYPMEQWAMDQWGMMSCVECLTWEHWKVQCYALGALARFGHREIRDYAYRQWAEETGETAEPVPAGLGGNALPGRGGASGPEPPKEPPPWRANAKPATPSPSPSYGSPMRFAAPQTQGEEYLNMMGQVTGVIAEQMKGVGEHLETGMKAVVEAMNKKGENEDPNVGDKFQAIIGLETKRAVKQIEDWDPDLDNHINQFYEVLNCYAAGRRKLRPIDTLLLFVGSFPEGSIRQAAADNEMRKARKDNRLPDDAKTVMEEVIATVRTYVSETDMQKKVRIEKKFEMLEQGTLSFSEFRTRWEEVMQDMKEADMEIPCADRLFRQFVVKVRADLRTSVMTRDWKIDGPDKPGRLPRTVEDFVTCIRLYLEQSADVNATSPGMDRWNYMGDAKRLADGAPAVGPVDQVVGGFTSSPTKTGVGMLAAGTGKGKRGKGVLKCEHCGIEAGQPGAHYAQMCPQKACDRRGERAKSVQNHQNKGTSCDLCGSTTHERRHHLLAAEDFAGGSKPQEWTPSEQRGKGSGDHGKGGGKHSWSGQSSWYGQEPKGKSKGEGKKGADASPHSLQCKGGIHCSEMLTKGTCPKYHPRAEYKALREKFQQLQLKKLSGSQGTQPDQTPPAHDWLLDL